MRRMGSSSSETKFLQELILYAASAALSCLVLFAGLRHLDPNREASKKALEHKKEIAKRLGRPLINTNPYEDVIACDVINPDHIDVEFESIGGLEAIKQALYELVILPLRRPELFSHGKLLGPQKGVLLYGPPGTGKTMLAKAIAKESGAVFINVRISNLMSKWFGDAQKLVTAVFSLAYKLQPAIIFIDEVDSFLGQRRNTDHEAMTNMKTEFMALWDGFTTDQNARVMVLAATNRPSELDEAILRRLPQAFEIGLPDRRGRAEILKVILKGESVEENINFDFIANLCEGYTGSDILELCKKAAYFPLPTLQGFVFRSQFLGKSTITARPQNPSFPVAKHPKKAFYAKFDPFEILGGRGLCNGEKGIEVELKRSVEETSTDGTKNVETSDSTAIPVPEDAFEKEMMGLTGGFPGGEKGLKKFIQENPPPPKQKVPDSVSITRPAKPKSPELPLLMPGMIAIVKNPNNPFYMYCGIVQRITDGKAGVLFEGGNWDRLITFRLEELERREKGPPMKNPKSVVLEALLEKKDPN